MSSAFFLANNYVVQKLGLQIGGSEVLDVNITYFLESVAFRPALNVPSFYLFVLVLQQMTFVLVLFWNY